ncbi:MAG TPA: GEVED domain-containing protein, partial [Saprospiraceae bacterium]|nr:GEVED domain-containing protein [Saprospiraceae bacterium]
MKQFLHLGMSLENRFRFQGKINPNPNFRSLPWQLGMVVLVVLLSLGGRLSAQTISLNTTPPLCPLEGFTASFSYNNTFDPMNDPATASYNVSYYLVEDGTTSGPLLGTSTIASGENFSNSSLNFFAPTVSPGNYRLFAVMQKSSAGAGPEPSVLSAPFYVGPRVTTNFTPAGNYCAGDEISVSYSVICPDAVSSLQLVLSAPGGGFGSGTTLLSTTNTVASSGSMVGTIPTGAEGTYRVQIQASNADLEPASGSNSFQVNQPQLTTTGVDGPTSYCAGDDITITYNELCLRTTPDFSSNNGSIQVRMSNPDGGFDSGTRVLTPTDNITSSDSPPPSMNTITVMIPNDVTGSTDYKFRVETVGVTNYETTDENALPSITVTPPLLETTGTLEDGPFCWGDEVTVLYSQQCLRSWVGRDDDIELQVRLSDPNGSFADLSETVVLPFPGATPTTTGPATAGNGGIVSSSATLLENQEITVKIGSGDVPPPDIDFASGANYKFRVEISNNESSGGGEFSSVTDPNSYVISVLTIDNPSVLLDQTFCQVDRITFAFSSGDDYPVGSEIRAIISQADGSFFPVNDPRNRVIGRRFWSVVDDNNDGDTNNDGVVSSPSNISMTVVIPYNMPVGTQYKIRLESTASSIPGCEYGDDDDGYVSINPIRFPNQQLPFTGLLDDFDACFGQDASFTINSESGNTPEWFELCTEEQFRTSGVGLESASVSDVHALSATEFIVATQEGIAKGNTTFTAFDNLDSEPISTIAVSGGRIYAASEDKLYVSASNGAYPTNIGFSTRFPGASLINDVGIFNGDIYLATNNGIYFNPNLDGSGGWSVFDSGTSYTTIYVTGSGGNRTMYGGAFSGLKIARSGSTSFSEERTMANTQGLNFSSGLAPIGVVNDIFVEGNGDIYLATGSGVAISTDQGYSFLMYNQGLTGGTFTVFSIAVSGERIYAAVPGGLALTHKGGGRFTVYNEYDGIGFGSPSSTALALSGNTVAVATNGGVARATFEPASSLGSSNTLTVSMIDYEDTKCRYYARINDGTCTALSGFARINSIPGPITVEPVLTENGEEISLCGGVTGQIKISGLVPGVIYDLVRTPGPDNNAGVGMPPNTSEIQPTVMDGDAYYDGSYLISGLSQGVYEFRVRSQFGGGCLSVDFDDPDDPGGNPNTNPNSYVELNDPEPPVPAYSSDITPTPGTPSTYTVTPVEVCLGDQVTFEMAPLTLTTVPDPDVPGNEIPILDERYRWFTDNAGTTPASNPESGPAVANEMPQSNIFYTIPGYPSTSNSLYVARYDVVTQCISDVVEAPYIISTPPSLTKGGITQPATTGANGTINLNVTGTDPGVNYAVEYDFIPEGSTTSMAMTQPYTGGAISITGPVGEYNSIRLVALTTGDPGCNSNAIPSCVIEVPVPAVDDSFVPEASSMTMGMGSQGAYLQNAIDPGCASDVFIRSGGIAVGRIRNPANPATTLDNQRVEMRGYIQFDLASLGIPENAIIDKVEYQPVSIDNGNQNVCGADPNGTPVQSVTGDVQFDVTQVNPLISSSAYTDARWNDLGEVKYADFTIAKPFAPATTLAGAWTDLGPDAVANLEQRRINGQDFQLGLRLSGNDFDLAFYQFHGIVFADEGSHKLRVTYHEVDYGDLPEAKFATDANGGFEGPSHRLGNVDDDPSPTAETLLLNPLYIGATVPDAERTANDNATADGDDNTDTDDEDIAYSPGGVIPGNNFFNTQNNDILVAGDTIRVDVPYTNNLSSVPGQLSIYFDWNDNGVFENDTERYSTSLGNGSGTHTFNIDIPFDAANAEIGVRLRFTTADIDAYGQAPNGEVEDLFVRVYSFDYADLPDATDPADPAPAVLTATGDYNTFWTVDGNRGPRALIDDRLSIGNLIDAEGNGQPEENAFGDDINGIDDEDGIIPPDTIRRDEPAIFYVFVKNLIPDPAPADDGVASAYLVGYVDWNDDGDFEDDFEQSSLIPINASGQFEVEFTVPPTPIPLPDEVAARFRLSSNPTVATSANGPGDVDLVSVGEIEDLFVNIVAYDWGDLPEPKFATDTEGGYPGPSHKIVSVANAVPPGMPSLYFGMTPPDAERNGQPSAMADGDDQVVNQPGIVRIDDEDLEQIGLYFKNQDPFKMVANADPALLESGDDVILELPVTNNTGRDAYLTAYFDWNDNGLFEGATESYRITIDMQGTDIIYQIPFTIPDYTPTALIGARVRISTLETIDAYGPAPDGEVEDFLIDVKQFDYGDLPDDDSPTVMGDLTGRGDYHTFYSLDGSRGPRHIINEDLSIGNTVDAEGNGQSQINAFGDDINGIDDEDGIIPPDTIIRDKPAVFYVFVRNLLDRPAYLRGFVDWNDNGDFEDDPTYEKSDIIEIPVGASGYYEVSFTVPPMPVPLPDRVGARFRLSDSEGAVSLSTGPASPSNDPPGVDVIGEVHDLFVPIAGFDWGDLPEPQYITDREGGYPGPSHKIVYIELDRLTQAQIDANPDGIPNLQIGATAPDAENEGIPTEKADGDDEVVVDPISGAGDRIDDEDLSFLNFVRPGTMMTDSIVAGEPIELLIPVGNYTQRNANLLVFVDWNGDGDFEDEEETKLTSITPIAPLATPVDYRIAFDIPMRDQADSVGVRIRLTTGEFFDPYGQALDGEVEDFVIEVKGTDYGDLPDLTANTAINDFQTFRVYDGPRHAVPVTPLLYLGDVIDTEEDGVPGLESIGDDENQIVNDEDGIIFLTPLAPGKEAQIAFSGTNNTDLPATIFMYADWENDGVLDLVTLSQNTIAAGATVDGQIATFTVPPTATFTEGNAFFRFRITTDAEFIATPAPTGLARDGEVEDYYVPVFQIGNLVWEDRNNNGRQDPEEIPLGIEGVRVVLRFGGVDEFNGTFDAINQTTILDPTTTALDGDAVEDYICETFTAEDGTYSFFGMIEGNYQLISVDTFNLTPSRADWIDFVTEEDLDNDGLALKEPWEYADGEIRQAKTQVFLLNRDSVATDEEGILDQLNPSLLDPNQRITLPDNKVEHRIDFAYTGFDFGDLLDTYGTVEDGSSVGENVSGIFPTDSVKVGNPLEGPKHIVTPEIYLGQCADAEEEGQPDIDAGQEVFNGQGVMPVADGLGDNPNDMGWNTSDQQDTLTCVNDESGVTFLTPLVPGSEAIISVAFQTSINNDGPDAFLQAYFDWNGDGDFYLDPNNPAAGLDPDEQIIFTFLNDDTLFLEPNTNAVELELSDQLDANPVILRFNVPEGALFQDGNFLGRFRIGKEPNLGPTGILPGNENFSNGIVPLGEVEDYFINLVRTTSGNIVWEDRDYDGIQDIDEPVIPGVKVTLEYAGLDDVFGNDAFERTYMTETNENGAFIFAGLIGQEVPTVPGSKYYRIIVSDPDNMTPTVNRDTFDVNDLSNCVAYNSDGYDSNIDDRTTENYFRIDDPLMMCVEEADPVGKNDIGSLEVAAGNTWPDNQIDETIDFGFVGFDYGDLPDTSSTDPDQYDYITLRDWLPGDPNYMGPRHAIQPRLYLGAGVDGELNAQPDLDAGSKAGGDDDSTGEDPIPFTQGAAG